MSDAESFTRLLYFGLAFLGLSQDEVWDMPFGLLMDLFECHRQHTGQSHRRKYIDEIIPPGI